MIPDFHNFIAHRGLHNDRVPENSLEAFRLAAEAGYAIELDIRITADGRLVVFHDKTLKRMCGVDGDLSSYTFAQLQRFRLMGTDQRIPLFRQVLRLVDGRVPLLIELKNGYPHGVMQKRLKNLLKDYKGPYAVEAFDPLDLLWYRIFDPEVYRGLLTSTHRSGSRWEYLARLITAMPLTWPLIADPDFIAADLRTMTPAYKKRIAAQGRSLFLWTIRTDEQWQRSKEFSDTIIFESIDPR